MFKKSFRNSLIFAAIVIPLLLIDLFLKNEFFEFKGNNIQGQTQFENSFIGIRSYAHTSSTIFSFLNINMNDGFKIAIMYIVVLMVVTVLLAAHSKFTTIGISIVLAGVLGNTYDTTFHLYVRDIFYTPWADRGTFNLADLLVVIGGVVTLSGMMTHIIKNK